MINVTLTPFKFGIKCKLTLFIFFMRVNSIIVNDSSIYYLRVLFLFSINHHNLFTEKIYEEHNI